MMAVSYTHLSIDAVEKKPSTSELVDWIRALQLSGVDVSKIAREIPFIGVLLKKDKDISCLCLLYTSVGASFPMMI